MAEYVCEHCGEDVSGPDQSSVQDAMDRHMAKRHVSGRKPNQAVARPRKLRVTKE